MTEKEIRAEQIRAYENRDELQPGDVLILVCSDTMGGGELAVFALPSGEKLILPQDRGKSLSKGDSLRLRCAAVATGKNGYGRFVDYVFTAEDGRTIRINGPDAQALSEKRRQPVVIRNLDIPILQEVMGCMQGVKQAEQRRQWQKDRLTRMTQSLTGMPGGGGPKGLDSAIAAMDELSREEVAAYTDYVTQLRLAERILNEIPSVQMRSLVTLKYVMNRPDREIRDALAMTRGAYERTKRRIEQAERMTKVEWPERYQLGEDSKEG